MKLEFTFDKKKSDDNVKNRKITFETATGSISPLGAQASALYDLFCTHGYKDINFSALIKYLRGEEVR